MNIVEALIRVKTDTQAWVAENLLSKLDKNNPVATGAFSLNRKADSDVGNWSVAEGYDTEASGYASHAEGGMTKAKGEYAHAEGYSTEAATYGHAEGLETIASSKSHAEGAHTSASGEYSHAEGTSTESKGYQSHAEGNATIAGGRSQHVQGEYNIEDVVDDPAVRGKYAHIVGNGTSDDARSNAHTVAWDGTGWFARDVYVGGSGQDDELAGKVLTNKNIDAIPTEDSLNVISSGSVYTEFKTTKLYVDSTLAGKQDAPIRITADEIVDEMMDDNSEGIFTNVCELDLNFSHARQSFGTVVFSASGELHRNIVGCSTTAGDNLDDATNGEKWEFNFYDGDIIWRNRGVVG